LVYLRSIKLQNPNGKKVLIIENDGNTTDLFNSKWVITSKEASSVETYIWQ
ncbi:MAG: glucosylceramidase, partial [Flavobacterium sp.]|nr:glucosylceramidase [Flavobacterium sp.]